MTELSSRFNPQDVEDKWLRSWEERNIFHAEPDPKKKPYTIVIPPPNVTGILHMGHALNNTLQDIMVRFKRMQGFATCWMPGTDHAGIATQNVVEKQLAKEGKKRQDVGREKFIERLWEWKKQYGDTIIHQLKKLGSSCDWPRTRFTMDEDYSRAVTHVFVELYKKELVYQGNRIINWCPRCQTALSDEEAEHQDTQGNLYHILYPFKDKPNEHVIVATTRPETMLGDTAVAVNPKDKRYKKLIGKTLVLPLMNREIKIIADEFVDPKFGTGAVKVTPSHDPNDFAMGKRHKLEFINILHPDGRLNENAGRFNGQDRFAGRKAVVEALKTQGLLEKIEPHQHAVGHCYRCHTVVEPYLSKQWFVKMKPLAHPAIEAVKKGKIKFTPKRWTKVYLNWMENIQDWCISRQIWWGHRIPVWYCPQCKAGKNIIVSETAPKQCPHCQSTDLRQDEDVLDTWFSSWLWPFATFGWPKKNQDLEYFYPTASLFTASEIIFFWVARMIMAGFEFMGERPFSDVYIHGTVRDTQGRKMSKSLGNAIDPLEIIREYGADALRFSLIINSGQDLFISKEKFEVGRNFANKIWNATRLILMNASAAGLPDSTPQASELYSRWILSRFHRTLDQVTRAIEGYRFSEAETLIYDFFWKNFCDWHLELIKDQWSSEETQQVTLHILEQSLKIMHPFMPFVTEEIFHILRPQAGSLSQQSWPKVEKKFIDAKIESEVDELMEIITAIRNLRSQWNISQGTTPDIVLIAPKGKVLGDTKRLAIQKLAKTGNIRLSVEKIKIKESASSLAGPFNIFIPLQGIIEIEKEKNRLQQELQQQVRSAESLSNRLQNKEFLKKAPADIVAKEKERLANFQAKIEEFRKILADLS